MEKELKIVLSVFLFYFIFGLTQIFKTQAFITPVFLTSFILVFCSLLFWLMNLKEQRPWLLLIMLGIQTSWAFSDVFFTSFISQHLPALTETVNSKTTGLISLSIFYLLNFTVVYFLFRLKERKLIVLLILCALLVFSVVLVLINLPLLFKLSLIIFSIVFFYFGQTGSTVETKTLRVVSYQFLLLGLLQSFEYFL